MKQRAGADRRRHRPAGQRRRDASSRSTATAPSRLGLTLGDDRLGALQRLRPAPGGDDLRRAQPVPRDHGMGAALRAGPERARRRVRAGARRDRRPRQRRRDAAAAAAAATARRHVRANPGARDSSTGNALSNTRRRRMVPLGAVARFASARRRPRSATRTPSWRRRSRSTSPRAARSATRSAAIEQAEADIGMPTNVRGSFQGTALAAQQSQGQQALLIVAAHRRDLHRARHALREPGASGHGAVDAALGGRRRGARAAAVPHGVLDHRPDRRVPADRHRQEERDPDHRLRARGRAHARPLGASRRCARPACCASARS